MRHELQPPQYNIACRQYRNAPSALSCIVSIVVVVVVMFQHPLWHRGHRGHPSHSSTINPIEMRLLNDENVDGWIRSVTTGDGK